MNNVYALKLEILIITLTFIETYRHKPSLLT